MRRARAARPQRQCMSWWREGGQGRATTLSLSTNPGPYSRASFTHFPSSFAISSARAARARRPRASSAPPPGTPAAHGVVPRAQLDPDRVPQPLGELTRAAAVHARRHHRELGRSDAADRIGATPARLEQPRDAAQRLDAIAPSVLAVAVGSDRYAGNRRIV